MFGEYSSDNIPLGIQMDTVQNFTLNIDGNGNSCSLPCSSVNKVWFNGHKVICLQRAAQPSPPDASSYSRLQLNLACVPDPGTGTRLALTLHPALYMGGPKMWLCGPDFHTSGLGSTALSVHLKLSLPSPQLAPNAIISFRS